MEIKEGYKMTEVGIIPEDWEVKKIKSFAKITTGSQNTQDKNDDGTYPFYVRSQKIEHIDRYIFDTEGVITAGDGVGTGKVYHYVNGKFGLHQRAYLIHEFTNISAKYFFWGFSRFFYDRVKSMTAKSSVDSVRMDMIAEMDFRIPSNETEQTAIAEALSDIDSLIASLDKLIMKKKNIKQGAMQNLLTGKVRLEGYNDEWKRKKISSFADITTGSQNTQDKVEDGIYPFYVRSQQVERINKYIFDTEGIITAGDGVGTGKVFHYVNGKFGLHQRAYLIYNFVGVDAKFFFWIFSKFFYERIHSLTAKSSVDSVRKDMIADMEVFIPSNKDEQTAIADILFDIEKEIECLQQKRDKYIAIKEGMMQQLLTGKIRLV